MRSRRSDGDMETAAAAAVGSNIPTPRDALARPGGDLHPYGRMEQNEGSRALPASPGPGERPRGMG